MLESLNFFLATGNSHFKDLRTALKRRQRTGVLATPDSLRIELDEDRVTRSSFNECLDNYYDQVAELEQQAIELSALANAAGRRPIVIAFDNVDRLDDRGQEEAAEVARSVSAGASSFLPIVLACRTRNLPKLRDVADTLKALPVAARPSPHAGDNGPESVSTWAVVGIFRRRLEILDSDDFWLPLIEANQDLTETRRETQKIVARTLEMLDILWPLNGRAGRHSIELGEILVKWHRGNIRDVSLALYSLLGHMRTDPTFTRRDVVGKRVRNLVYRQILGQQPSFGASAAPGAPAMASTLQLFEAHPEPGPGSPFPFYFLKFRLLRLLGKNANGLTFSRIVSTMKFYGVDNHSLEAALDELTTGTDSSRPLVHVATSQNRGRRFECRENGAYLAHTLASKCEYLYASALSIPTSYEKLALDPLLPRFRTRTERLPSDEMKVVVASLFIINYVVPRLREEHPYMLRDRWSAAESARLMRFRRDFGFDTHSWFINQLVGSIRGHASENNVVLPERIENELQTIELESYRLDQIVRTAK